MPRLKPPPAALHSSPDDVEAQFYEALQNADIARLMAVWVDDDEIVCVHPGGDRVVGAAAVRASFEAIFAVGPVPARPSEVRRLQGLGCEVHHLVERVRLAGPEGVKEVWALATNVYLKTPQGWRLAAHHASQASENQTRAVLTGKPSTLH